MAAAVVLLAALGADLQSAERKAEGLFRVARVRFSELLETLQLEYAVPQNMPHA
jgi:hypothetical protein